MTLTEKKLNVGEFFQKYTMIIALVMVMIIFALLTNGTNVNAKKDHICMLARDLFDLMWKTYVEE